MVSSPTTSIIGALILVSEMLKAWKPSLGPVIDEVVKGLIGSGFIAAADANRKA